MAPRAHKDAWDQVTLAALTLVTVTKLIVILRSAVRSRLHSRVAAAVKRILAAGCSQTRGAADEIALEVDKRIRTQKVLHVRRACQALALLSLPINILNLCLLAEGHERPATAKEDCVMLVLHLTLTATLVCPGMVSWRTIDFLYVGVTFGIAIVVWPFTNRDKERPQHSLAVVMMGNCVMAALSMARRDLYVVVPMALLVGLASCRAIWCHAGLLAEGTPSLHRMVLTQACTMLFVMGCSHALNVKWWELTYETLAVTATKQLLSAATALLRSYSDMVVTLDSDGVILEPALNLGSFLLRGPGYGLQGYRLADLMADEEDQRAFGARLQAPREGSMDSAESLHVRMRDANGMVLRLQLLFFRFMHVDNTVRYMVGVCGNFPALGERVRQPAEPEEVSEAAGEAAPPALPGYPEAPAAGAGLPAPGEGAEQPQEATAPGPAGAAGTPSASGRHAVPRLGGTMPVLLSFTQHEAPGGGGASLTSPFSSSDGSSAARRAEETVSELSSAQRPVLVLDAEGQDFPILESSEGFRARIGRLPPNACLMDVVKRRGAVMDWLTDTLRHIDRGARVPDDCELTFAMPHGRVTAMCKVWKVGDFYDAVRAADGQYTEGPDEEASPESDGALKIELLFFGIRHRPGAGHEPHGRFRSARPALARL